MENKQKQQLFNHLRKTGNISDACRQAGVARNLYYRLFYRDAQFRNDVNRAKAEYLLASQ